MSTLFNIDGGGPVTVPAGARVATFSNAFYQVFQTVGFPNYPNAVLPLFSGVGAFTSAVFASGASLTIVGNAAPLYLSVGTSATVTERLGTVQGDPGTLNATGTLTSALIQSGIVTSTTAAAVVATLDTGAIMDASATFAINDCFDWTAIATGANAFTVTASAGHTVVGAGAVATGTSGRFRTRKTAAATFVTYRL